jgi:AGZA family xanthine/uracil permease-like MFS transporter
VTLGDLHKPEVMALLGFLLIVVLDRSGAGRHPDRHRGRDRRLVLLRRQPVPRHLLGASLDRAHLPASSTSRPRCHGLLNVVLVFFLVELFDATGTLMGVAKRAGLLVPAAWSV